jgi:hypothetical protein
MSFLFGPNTGHRHTANKLSSAEHENKLSKGSDAGATQIRARIHTYSYIDRLQFKNHFYVYKSIYIYQNFKIDFFTMTIFARVHEVHMGK